MSKIVVFGNEEFVLGFELVGIETYLIEELEEIISNKESDIGIVVISSDDYEKLSLRIKNTISKLLKPIVVILSEDDIKGNSLREKIISAMGVDLLK